MSKKTFNLDSFYQLLKGRVFYNINYQNWLLESINNATTPIHPKFGSVINEFVLWYLLVRFLTKLHLISYEFTLSIVLFWQINTINYLNKSLKVISRIVQRLHLNKSWCSCIFWHLTTILLPSKQSQSWWPWTTPKNRQVNITRYSVTLIYTKFYVEYSEELLEYIPVRYILNHVDSFEGGNAYRSIYSDLLALSANLFPELFDIQSFLMQEGQGSEEHDLWTITSLNKDWKKGLNTIELKKLLNQWDTNPSMVVEGTLN